jgi:hypothetical protein
LKIGLDSVTILLLQLPPAKRLHFSNAVALLPQLRSLSRPSIEEGFGPISACCRALTTILDLSDASAPSNFWSCRTVIFIRVALEPLHRPLPYQSTIFGHETCLRPVSTFKLNADSLIQKLIPQSANASMLESLVSTQREAMVTELKSASGWSRILTKRLTKKRSLV